MLPSDSLWLLIGCCSYWRTEQDVKFGNRLSLLENHTISFTSSQEARDAGVHPLRVSLGFTSS